MDRKSFAIYAITKHGVATANKIKEDYPGADLYVSKKLAHLAPKDSLELPLPFSPMLKDSFPQYDCHIFVISVGAVVRMIAPLLVNKKVDPAVLCIDDANRFTICVLSGHVGRGNEYTTAIASCLDNEPVITTASDAMGTLTVDILGRELGWTLEDQNHNVTKGCAAVVNEEPVAFVQECGEAHFWPLKKDLPTGVVYGESLDDLKPSKYGILLIASDRDIVNGYPEHYKNAVVYRPKSLIVGMGCDRDTPMEILERGLLLNFKEFGLSIKSIKAIATVSLKANEKGLLALCEKYDWQLIDYTPEELDQVEGIENPSEVVKKYIGTRTVAEGAALKLSASASLLVPKQKYKEDADGKNMTLAICRIPFAKRN